MAHKPKTPVKPDDPAEYKRFLATAKEAEADETGETFDEAIALILSSKSNGEGAA